MISVATLTAILLAPLPLSRVGAEVSHAEYSAVSTGLDEVSTRLSLGYLARLAQRQIARQRRHDAFVPPDLIAARPAAAPWKALAPGIRYRAVAVVAQSGEKMKVHEVKLDPSKASVRIVYRNDAQPVETTATRTHAVAAVNGSYFDPDRKPLGYLKIQGRLLNGAVASGAAFTGVFTMKGRTPRIVSRADFDGHKADTALQAGPRLVANGAPTTGLRETRSFRQTGIAVTRGGGVVLYATDGSYRGMTWKEMQALLTGPEAAGGIDPRDVLNLDGGSSSQMVVRAAGVSTGFPTAVPVVVAMYAR
jgi:uncharacterized protein YigE (DUF2233 family)